jgi:RND superfamily putative drug exporter
VPVRVDDDHAIGILQVIPEDGPASAATEQLVQDLRADKQRIADETGSTISLTGQVAAQIDVSDKLSEALPPYLAIVVGLSLVLLLLVFRSVVVPVVATLGFLLSLAASFGATVAVYQWGWGSQVFDVATPGPIMSFLPILLTGILFGLAMDYQVFLVSAMRESYAHGEEARSAVRSGFRHAAPVVTAAALIMTAVFAGFVFSHLTMIRAIGFSLAVGVLVDAFVVRMTLTPAVMHLLGRHAWYLPRWLDRILPDVDVEGARLAKHLPPAEQPQERREPVTVG